jgi:hypothetical protein
MYTHPRATTGSAHPTPLTISNGHTGGYPVYHRDDHINGYANGHPHGNVNGHPMEKMDNPVVVMRRPNLLEYPFITVKAIKVVRLGHLFSEVNTNYLSSFGLHVWYLDRSCGARLGGINYNDYSLSPICIIRDSSFLQTAQAITQFWCQGVHTRTE